MTVRPGPLKAAAALAAGFIVVRVVYRVLFRGADGDGLVLWSLPEFRLPAPFGHVVLLGTVTADGLWAAVLSAVPIALTILAFGVLNAVLDLPRLLARGARSGPFRGIARALSVAWATLPSLADAVRSARFAQRLRGERGGARLLAPVLERTLERATAVAAALELRGYAGRPADGAADACEHPVMLREAVAGFGADAVVRIESLELAPRRLIVVAGDTGSGKSTLLRALAGLHSHVDGGWLRGTIEVVGVDRALVPPRDTARTVGVVLQHPREAFATERVADEIGLALELRGVASVLRAARVREVAARVGIDHLLDRPLRALSAGEATLVAIAAAIVEQPILLLVDEPLADLDVAARARIVGLLAALAHEAGMAVVVAEHRVAELAGVADAVTCITPLIQAAPAPEVPRPGPQGTDERSCAHGAARTAAGTTAGPGPYAAAAPPAATCITPLIQAAPAPEVPRPGPQGTDERSYARAAVLTATGVTVRDGERVVVDDARLELRAGEIVALTGPNGAGKSSLLVALATRADGVRVPSADPRTVALVPDASDDLFVRDTVAAECRATDRRVRTTGSAERFARLLGLDADGPEFAALLGRHPRDLSAGQRRCLAVVLQTAHAPHVLLIDEPTRGLDPRARALVAQTIEAAAHDGAAVVVATHDAAFADLVAGRTVRIDGGVLQGSDGHDRADGRDGFDTPAARATQPPEGEPNPAPGTTPPEEGATLAQGTTPREEGATLAQGTTPREEGATLAPRPTPPTAGASERGAARPRAAVPSARVEHPAQPRRRRAVGGPNGWRMPALIAANLAALAAFTWPLVAIAVPAQAHAAVPYIALALAPLAVVLVFAALDGTVRSAHTLAHLAVLAAIGAAIRIVSTGVGGVEALFILLILAGRAFGARFGLLLGATSIALSALVWGGVGPWLPFQMFACGWVAAGAALLPRRVTGAGEIAMLCGYGILSSYVFGLLMNLWFWPFAVGSGTGISYVPGGSLGENLASFLVYSFVTSSAGWDTLRAVTTVIGLVTVGRAALAAFRRAKPVASPSLRERVTAR